MHNTIKLVFNGRGGQGIGLAGEVIAKAINTNNPNYHVALNSNYGAQARGGLSQVSLIISKQPILFPLVDEANLLIISSEEGLKEGTPVHKNGLILADEGLDIDTLYPHNQRFHLPLAQTLNQLGFQLGINMLILGVVSELLKEIVSIEMLKSQIGEVLNCSEFEEQLNIIDAGITLINQINKA